MTGDPSFLLQPASHWFHDFVATSFHFKKKFRILYVWFLLKSHLIIRIVIVVFGLEKTSNCSLIKFADKRWWIKWLRHFLLALFLLYFWFCRCMVFISIRLIEMSYWWLMIDRHPCFLIEAQLCVCLTYVESYWILWHWYNGFSQKFRGFFYILVHTWFF